jgi:hypothetical protein
MEKPGFKTSEFWLTLAAVLVSMLMAAGVFGPQGNLYKALEVVAGILAAMGYTYVRGTVKNGATPKPPE